MLRGRPALPQPWVVEAGWGFFPLWSSTPPPLLQVTNLSPAPGLCFTPQPPQNTCLQASIPLLRGKHKTRLDWFLISTGMW